MISSHTAPTDKKAEQESPPTSTAGRADGHASESGFTLIEIVCVLAVVGLLVSILLPEIPRGTSRSRLQAYALEIATLLNADRNAAIRRRTAVSTRIDALGRSVQSGASSRNVLVPPDVQFDTALASRCNQQQSGFEIRFFSSGMSCGGVIALSRLGTGYQVRVNWFTGGVEIVQLNTD